MTVVVPGTDRERLVTEDYRDASRLNTRRSIYQWRQPRLDLVGLALERLAATPALAGAGGGAVLVDVGCADGAYVGPMRARWPGATVVGLDLSPGMAAATGAPVAVADAQRLPLPDGSATGMLCMHVLYHVPDPAAAVAELARVRAPHGTVLIASNAAGDKAELDALWRAATIEVTGGAPTALRHGVDPHGDLDRCELLARARFAEVARIELTGEVVVPDVAPVIAFMESQRSGAGQGLPVDEVLRVARGWLTETVRRTGAFRFTSRLGMLVCR
jgi:SAM-dependent methyltransferase